MQAMSVEENLAGLDQQAKKTQKLKRIGILLVALCVIGAGAMMTGNGMKIPGVATKSKVAQSGFGDRPNIIVMLMDDVGLNDYGYGGAPYKTPTLDRLAKNGMVMDNHYVFPSCSPTRMAFLTGRLPYEFGVTHAGYMTTYELPPEIILPELLNSAGYTSAGFGKWHAGRSSHWAQPTNRGFKTWTGFTPGMVTQSNLLNEMPWAFFTMEKRLTKADFDAFKKISPSFGLYAWEVDGKIKKVKVDKNTWADDMATDAALKVIDKDCNSQIGLPCFLSLNFGAAHAPIVEPPISKKVAKRCKGIKRAKRATYCRMMQKIDENIKRVVKKLKKTGKWKDTIIMISSDNGGLPDIGAGNEPYLWDGYGSNLPYRGTKVCSFEGGIKTRAIVTGGYTHKQFCQYTLGKSKKVCSKRKSLYKVMKKYWKKKGSIRKRGLMGIQDWYTTFASLAGVKPSFIPIQVDGKNMFDMLFANFRSPRVEFSVISGRTKTNEPRAAAIIRDRMKMVWLPASSLFVQKAVKMGWRKVGTLDGYWNVEVEPTVRGTAKDETSPIMLFDLSKDPTERKNLYNKKKYFGKRKALEGRMKELIKIFTADPYHMQPKGIYASVNEGYVITPWEDNQKYMAYTGNLADALRYWAKQKTSKAGQKIMGLEKKAGVTKETGGGH